LTCLRGRYHFHDVAKNRLTHPMIEGKAVEWPEGIEKLAEAMKGNVAMFLGSSLTDQELAAVKAATKNAPVTAKGFDAAKVAELLASFDKAKPDTAGLVRKMALLSKAVEFGKDAAGYPEDLKAIYSMGANIRGLFNSGVVINAPQEAVKAVKDAAAAIFVDCSPKDFGFTEDALKGMKKILLAPNKCEGTFDMILPITAWAEREGTYTGTFSGVKLPVRRGPLPPEGVRALRWILSEAMRNLGLK